MAITPAYGAMSHRLEHSLSLNELIFYRSWVEGTFKLQFLIDRYLPPGTRVADAKRSLRATQAVLVAVARRAKKHGQARLLLLDDPAARARPGPKPGAKPRSQAAEVAPAPSASPNGVPPAEPELVPVLAGEVQRPSFDSFVAQNDPNGDFSLDELQEIYVAEYGPLPADLPTVSNTPPPEEIRLKASSVPEVSLDTIAIANGISLTSSYDRHLQLRARRLALISELMPSLTRPPEADDEVEAWWDSWVSGPLLAAGVSTLGKVIKLLNERGPNWHQAVPKLGVVRATHCVQWLRSRGGLLADGLSPYADLPRYRLPKAPYGASPVRPPVRLMAKRPFDHRLDLAPPLLDFNCSEGLFKPPSHLDGSAGSNRARAGASRLTCGTDHAAITAWLARHCGEHQSNTYRAYRAAAERLLLWCAHKQNIPFSGISAFDVAAFLAFLRSPEPQSQWVSDRVYPRYATAWRPFVRPPRPRQFNSSRQRSDGAFSGSNSGLSDSSARQTLSILSGMCAWLVTMGYLHENPFKGSTGSIGVPSMVAPRVLDDHDRTILLDLHTRTKDGTVRGSRLGFALSLVSYTNIRLNELVSANLNDLEISTLGSKIATAALHVRGSKDRSVPLLPSVITALQSYLSDRGVDILAVNISSDDRPLISKLYATQGTWRMSPNAMHRLFVDFLRESALNLDESHGPLRDKLAAASVEWFRGGT